MRQQRLPKLAIRIGDDPPVDFVEQGDERRLAVPPTRRRADERLQRGRTNVRVTTVVPDDFEQQFRRARKRSGGRTQDEVDEALLLLSAVRIGQDLPQRGLEIGRLERPGTG